MVKSQLGSGYGKTVHFGNHLGYTQAVNQALRVADRIKIPKLTGCKKMEIIQSALRKQLESGGITLYGNSHNNGTRWVQMDWESIIRQHVKGL
ncbi:hypothetical protein [Wielerella bovis]|uniref:hypothetical protein n=1 Tax=Wielerella bovis TaxID=2917790 RepID=UPI002018D795|nr:hypothetical protein [Wielerella bovis]ULJ61592.1 hypothetical protein MIS46_06145 [Wielerella bovis]ULJ63708.1 hypothetical protein MIS33_05885 [Wielerella bovis]ULJ66115.1 hypothetical protein MIS31_07500 [Wielerella bovis]